MNVNSVSQALLCVNKNLSFTSANINIKALSDSHGQLQKLAPIYEDMIKPENIPPDKESEANVLSVVGDWFISGAENSYKTMPSYKAGDYQLAFFNEFVKKLSEKYKNLHTNFVPGNHEFDAGARYLNGLFEKMDATIISTNMDFKEGDTFASIKKSKKLVKSQIIEVADDKDPSLKHKAIFLGISPVNMQYYKNNITGVKFIDNVFKSKNSVTPDDYTDTLLGVDSVINDFKKKNPKGAVIVMSHTGANFAKNIIDLNPNINLVLDAHDHKKESITYKKVPIISLYKDFKKYHDIKIHFNDNGNVNKNIVSHAHYPSKNQEANTHFIRFYNNIFKKDFKKDISIAAKDNIQTLENTGVRHSNSYLANFITDGILDEIQKIDNDVEIFCLNASAIRGELPTINGGKANNIDISSLLNGIVRSDAKLYVNKITGEELLNIIQENVKNNAKAPENNPIFQFSGLRIDKTQILNHSNLGPRELARCVKSTSDNKDIDPDKLYTVANVEKFFAKSKNPVILNLSKEKQPLNANAKDLFVKYADRGKTEQVLIAKCDKRIF